MFAVNKRGMFGGGGKCVTFEFIQTMNKKKRSDKVR